MFSPLVFASLLAGSISQAAAASLYGMHDSDTVAKRLPDAWYHADDHPVHKLFRRQSDPTDGVNYTTVGSPAWTKAYPEWIVPANQIPSAWMAALNASIAAGNIPNIPASTVDSEGFTHYAGGLNPNGKTVCSGTYQCMMPGDIWNAPDGMLGCGFDDGPLPPSDRLYAFLKENDQHATHFFIGTNILQYPQQFLTAFNNGDDIAVHTWTHRYMTTLSNEQLIAEFGWTMQIIHNSTGGRLPKYWRPPYGDTDMRVQAIAREVFGLTAIIWNQDTNDWSLPGGTTLAKINASMTGWLTGKKSPGLIILEHELSDGAVTAFMNAYPVMKANGWNITSTAKLAGGPTYQNADDSVSPVTPASGILLGDIISSEAPSLTYLSATGSATATSASGGSSGSSKSSGASRSSLSWVASTIAGAVMFGAVSILA